MKNVMILAGGTATAWHIAFVLKNYFAASARLIICDVNEPKLVHTSALADCALQVPPIQSAGYYESMLRLFDEQRADIVIPLIDDDILLFPSDNPDLCALKIYSTAPERRVVECLSDKSRLETTLSTVGIATPRLFRVSEVLPETYYYVKDAVGCGSRGVRKVRGSELDQITDRQIIQELCTQPEITVDVVYDGNNVFTICRERLEIKLGVSTKCRIYHDPVIQNIVEKLCRHLPLPYVSCAQFMKNSRGEWAVTDYNLRSGAGTAMSAAVGFEGVRYAAAKWLNEPADTNWLSYPSEIRYVIRTYQEIVTA